MTRFFGKCTHKNHTNTQQYARTHTHIQPGSLPPSQLLLWCRSVLFNREQRRGGDASQCSLVSGLFCVALVCLCVYKKIAAYRSTGLTWQLLSETPERGRWRESEMSSNLPPRWKLGQQQEITRLLCCDSEAKTCWVHIFNCCETHLPHSAGYLRDANENLLSNSVWISNCIARHMCSPLCTANPVWRNCTTDPWHTHSMFHLCM